MITLNEDTAVKLSGKKLDDLKTVLQKEDGELKEDASKLFADLVTEKFKEVEKDRSENSYKKGIKEKAESIEAALKPLFKKHGVEAEKLEDAANELADKLKKVDTGKSPKEGEPKDLTEEELRKLPAYQSLLDKELEKVKANTQEWEQKYNDFVSTSEREKVLSVSRDQALSLLDGKNAVWGSDKLAQLNYFFRAVGTENISLDDKGKPVLLDSDGNPLRDESRNKVTFESWILDNWKNAGYTFHDAPPGSGSAGAGQGGQGSGGGDSKVRINSVQHYETLMKEAGMDLSKQAEISQAFSEWSKTNPVE